MALISEMWKEKTIKVLKDLYGDDLNEEYLEDFLNKEIEKKKPYFPELSMRNLYTQEHIQVKLDEILDIIKREDLCIEANNTLTYSLNKVETPLPKILIKQKADRNFHKKKMLDAKAEIGKEKKAGTFREDSEINTIFKNENGLQLKIKVFMNSVYGVQGQKGSILYAPDTAGAVTSQGREMISEMTWTIERLLYGTLHFYSIDEYLSYFYTIGTEIRPNNEFLKYITYIPTFKDVEDQIIKSIRSVGNLYDHIEDIGAVLFARIRRMTDIERIYYYYASNLFNLISKNSKVYDLFDSIMCLDIDYLSPVNKMNDETKEKYAKYLDYDYTVKGTFDKVTEGLSDDEKQNINNLLIYEKINPILKEINNIINEFVVVHMSTPKRQVKYQTKTRRAITVSDTDSVILNLHPYVVNLYHLYCIKHGVPFKGEHIGFYNEKMDFKLVNIVTSICVFGTEVAGDIFVKNANIPQEYRKWIEMKNEFLFKRLIMYTNVKKNYAVNVRLQEGKLIDDLNTTGIKFNASTIHPEIKKLILDTIEKKIIRSEEISPIEILHSIKDIEAFIVKSIKNGDLTFGKKARYSGPKGYKTGVYRNDAGRAAFIWNLLYPNTKISPGDYGSVFTTTLITEEDVKRKMLPRFPTEANILLEKVFKDPNLSKYGLKSIMIPLGNESVKTLPKWLIPFIDYNRICNKHLQSLISLTPSIGLKMSAISSSKQSYSPLISF